MFIRLRLNSEYSKFLTALLYKTQFRLYNCKCTSILFCLFRSLKKREAYLKEKKILTSWWIKLLQSLQGNEWLRVKYIDVIYLKGIQLGYIEQKITYGWENMNVKNAFASYIHLFKAHFKTTELKKNVFFLYL